MSSTQRWSRAGAAALLSLVVLACGPEERPDAAVFESSGARPWRATVPEASDGELSLFDVSSGVRVAFSLRGASTAVASVDGDRARYVRALPGADLIIVARDGGIEDHVELEAQPLIERITYDVDVSAAAGVRFVASTLELLDARSTPRLRVAPPYVVDRAGTRRRATLALRGCAHDTDPRPPWDRPVTPPGASRCELDVSWGREIGDPIEYPAMVDPLWSVTGDLAVARTGAGADAIGGSSPNRMLIVGGLDVDGVPLASAEVYDADTGTWAATGSLPSPRASAATRRVQAAGEDSIVVIGGCDSVAPNNVSCGQPMDTTFEWTAATGSWTLRGSLPQPRTKMRVARMGDGRLLAAGGFVDAGLDPTDTAAVYDPVAGTWTPASSMADNRSSHAVIGLADGRVLVVGGRGSWNNGNPVEHASAEIYDPALDEWTPAGASSDARRGHGLSLLPDGRVLVAAGVTGGSFTPSVDLYDPRAGSWSAGAPIPAVRVAHVQALLPNGHVLFAGGCCEGASAGLADTLLYDPSSDSWTEVEAMPTARKESTGSALSDGRVVVTAGRSNDLSPLLTSTFVLSLLTQGDECSTDGECLSGSCADGVCCDSPCEGACEACAKASGAAIDGECARVAQGAPDPHGVCVAAPSGTCGATGLCDERGACAVAQPGSACGPCPVGEVGTCDASSQCTCAGVFCLDADTVSNGDGTTTECAPYLCVTDACASTCNSSDACVPPLLCNADHACVSRDSAVAGDADGCACRARPARSDPSACYALCALAVLSAAVRRRRPAPRLTSGSRRRRR